MTLVDQLEYQKKVERVYPPIGIRVCPGCLREIPAAEMLPAYEPGGGGYPDKFVCTACHYKWMLAKAQAKTMAKAKADIQKRLARIRTQKEVDFVGFVAEVIQAFGDTKTAAMFMVKQIKEAAEHGATTSAINGMLGVAKMLAAAAEHQSRQISAEDLTDEDLAAALDAHFGRIMDEAQRDEVLLKQESDGR
jgi:hypothetical protein